MIALKMVKQKLQKTQKTRNQYLKRRWDNVNHSIALH